MPPQSLPQFPISYKKNKVKYVPSLEMELLSYPPKIFSAIALFPDFYH